jgi:hypothetical protein
MDDLRKDDYDAEPAHVEDESPDAPIDADVLDRLAAYGHTHESKTAVEPERWAMHEPEPPSEVPKVSEPEHQPESAVVPDAELSFDPVLEPGAESVPMPEPPAVEEAHVPDMVVVEELVVEDAPASGRFGRRGNRVPKPRKEKEHRDKRAKKLVGLKIGGSQIAAAQVVNNGSPELVEVFREPLEPGVVVSGEIRDPETLGDALKRFFELHKLPKRGVRLGLSNNRIGVRVFDIDGVAEEQLENAIRFRAEEVLPIPLEQAVLDYVVLGEDVRPDGTQSQRILLVVAYRDVVERYL